MTFGLASVRPSLLALAIAVSPVAAQPNVKDSQLETRNYAIVRDAFDAWASKGTSVFGLLAPNAKWTILGSGPVAGTYNGANDFIDRASRPLIQRLTTPIKPVVHHIWASGDRVIIRFDGSATTTSGKPYRNQFIWIFRMDKGLVVEAEAFLDLVAYQEVVDNNQPRAQ